MRTNQKQKLSENRGECESSDSNMEPRSHSSFFNSHNKNLRPSLCSRLKNLPEIKAGPGFDQKMAALFAMELEEEIRRKSASFQNKTSNIRLPDLIPDLRKELF